MILRLLILWFQWGIYALVSYQLEDRYAYEGIEFEAPGPITLVVSMVLLLIPAAVLKSAVRRPSEIALWFLASFVTVPTLVVAAVNPTVTPQVGWSAGGAVLLGLLVAAGVSRRRGSPTGFDFVSRMTKGGFIAFITSVSLIAIVTIVVGYGIAGFDLTFGDEYVRRLAARESPVPYPGANYLVAWYKAVLIPLTFVLAVVWRRFSLGALGVFGSLLIFSFTGEKSILVTPVLALLLVVALRRSAQGDGRPWLPGLMSLGLLAAPMLLTRVWPSLGLDVLVTRRIGLVPGLLTARYVEFAQMEGFTRFSQSWLKPFSLGDDSQSLGLRVGDWLHPGAGMNANANLWADGYVSAGLFGVVLVSLLLGLTLRVFDRIATARDPIIAGATLGITCLVFTNGYFHTSLLTGGVIFGAALMLALPTDGEHSINGGGLSRRSDEVKPSRGSRRTPSRELRRGHGQRTISG